MYKIVPMTPLKRDLFVQSNETGSRQEMQDLADKLNRRAADNNLPFFFGIEKV